MSRMPGALALTSLFSSNQKPREEDDRLLDLYWNRAQLKKEYAQLRKERFSLLDALTKQEGKSVRLQQKLDYLEDLLTEEDSATNTVAYYSLRKLWRRCGSRLVRLAGELKKQREAKATQELRQTWKARNARQLDAVKSELASLNERRAGLERERQYLGDRLTELGSLFGFWKRRGVREDLDVVCASLQQINEDYREAEAELNRLSAEKTPEFEVLSLESRRAINCTVLALAELLAEHFSSHGIMELSRATLEKSVGSVRYGSPKECRGLITRLSARQEEFEAMERAPDFSAKLGAIAQRIRKRAAYNKPGDAIPTPGSLNDCAINVLAKDIWSVSGAMVL